MSRARPGVVAAGLVVLALLAGCATDPAGTRNARWPHVAATGDGNWRPDPGYLWVRPGDNNDLRVRWAPNVRHPRSPHVVSAETEGNWQPEDGYTWRVPGDRNDLSVVWAPGRRARSAHMQAAEQEGRWYPELGYEWTDVNDRCWGCVKRQPAGTGHPTLAHVVLSGFDTDGHALYEPQDGWAWTTPGVLGPTRPTAAGTPSRAHPNVVSNGDGAWRPASGYVWEKPDDPNDLRVKRLVTVAPPPPPRQVAPPRTVEPVPSTAPAVVAEPPHLAARATQVLAALQAVSREAIFRDQRPPAGGRAVSPQLIENNSQTFFRALGEELSRNGLPSWSKEFPLRDLGRLTSEQILERIAADGEAWEHLTTWQDAQRRANEGTVVVGGLRADGASHRAHGHLVVVAPDLRGSDGAAGAGPFVRDGNERVRDLASDAPQRASAIWRGLDAWEWYVRLR